MSYGAAGLAPAREVAPHFNVRAASAAGLIVAIWFLSLSQWLGVTAGRPITTRQNVLFDSDMSMWVDRMIGNQRSPEQNIHPLELILWRVPCRVLARAAGLVMPSSEAAIFGPRLLVAIFAGAGAGALFGLALWLGVHPLSAMAGFIIYLLFTSSATISLAEHFGITNGLMSIAFVSMIVISNERARRATLGALAVVVGGTSVLNGLLPAYCLFESEIKSEKRKLGILPAAVPIGIAASALLYRISGTVHRFFGLFATFRILRDPLKAIVYSVFMFTMPAVGPTPSLMGGETWRMVSYEPMKKPLELGYYLAPQGIGALAWVALLGACAWFGYRDERTRPWMRVAFGWILFNMVFYNVWGRELFLWAPAWSWTLMAIVVLGLRHIPRTFLAVVFVPIAASQIYTFEAIKSLLLTIRQ